MTRHHWRLILLLGALTGLADAQAVQARKPPLPRLDEVVAARQDLWGEAALRQPGGPTYEFFRRLLPPLRYVDAPFRHYPIVLSAPGAPVKARLVSNGSGLNALARQPNWRGETGTPVTFRLGATGELFGEDLRRLDGPRYEEGWLPVVRLRYRQGDAVYTEEAFAAVDPGGAAAGMICVKIGLEQGRGGKIVAQFEGAMPYGARDGVVRTPEGAALAAFEPLWKWNPSRNTLTAELRPGESAVLAVATRPTDKALPERLDGRAYDDARRQCLAAWGDLLGKGMQVEVPEPVVNNAWRSVLAGSYALLAGDEIRYSAGNQYAKLYEGEGSDAARSFLLWGRQQDARRMIVPLLDYTRAGLEFHQAAFKLQMLAHYYWITRDAAFLREQRPRWEKELNRILEGIEPESGLLPREKYCGDIDTRVYSLNSNANCWRALRDMAAVLEDLGEKDLATRVGTRAAAFRKTVHAAVERSIRRDVSPAFVPIAFFGEEQPYDPLTATKMGGYWNIMAQYVLGSGIFPADSEAATAITRTLQNRGGLCMGLLRTRANPTFWVDYANTNDLYGLRYNLTLLQRDEPDRALVGFYGKLAQGMTRDTFISAEGSALRSLDSWGRQMYLPPNSAGNAHFLWVLRCLLVQDWDQDDDARPDTLRLMFATPRAWLRDGAEVRVERAPTGFGEVSLRVRSRLASRQVLADVDLPERPARHTLLRLRLPEGWRLSGARTERGPVPFASLETLDLTGLTGRVRLVARVERPR